MPLYQDQQGTPPLNVGRALFEETPSASLSQSVRATVRRSANRIGTASLPLEGGPGKGEGNLHAPSAFRPRALP